MACMRDGFEVGKLLGDRFKTVSPLNHGSFGMVFAATDELTGDDVAIKCITKPGAAVEDTNCPAAIAVDDRSEELEIHSRLSAHPNIVNLITDFETENHQYMVLELCNNGDLYEAIRAGHGPLETEHVRSLMLQLVDAIDHLHSNGVYHRDIKPENIFLTSSGSMKLGDFGLATTETWSTEFAVGSDRYMAPEQFDASVYGYGYSPASADVWAIGIVLLNVLFQRNPFATPTQKDPLFADFVSDRQSLFDVFPNLSQDTFNVLVHSLALDPANRSLGAVREALKAVVSFTTDDEPLDDFCTEQTELVPTATAAREPLRTPSISTPNMCGESFPWSTALLKTPQKTDIRQLSSIQDEEIDMYPESIQYEDTDEVSLSSTNIDSGLGMSYKSGKSIKSPLSKATVSFAASLPISFSRPTTKVSPYGAQGSGFSKSWSDLWDEEEEMVKEEEEETQSSFDSGMEISRVSTVKPLAPQLSIIQEETRGSVTPRPSILAHDDLERTASPLRKLVESDKAHPMSPKQRSASVMDRWAALGNLRRSIGGSETAPTSPTKTKYTGAFTTFSPFRSTKKPKSTTTKPADATPSNWRQGSPTRHRARSITHKNSASWERKEKEHSLPKDVAAQTPWSIDTNWRQHKASSVASRSFLPTAQPSPLQHRKYKNFLDEEFDNDMEQDMEWSSPLSANEDEWVGGWSDFHL
ncbi:Hypothetical protein R9X50_00404100 [Acrodontium crateriforme]|uniref:Protein kinase domain-containing protein n=1 Tax=Acrodontium crateriforme TaxID=150365 RepID=A0AAQ3M5E3_9PEZI|nr:Hypothetical protein R9X50_00404100 [Acrodontium crateriforme]